MKVIATDKAPGAVGPYSQGLVVEPSGLLFVSGQIGLDPASGTLVPGGIEDETRRALANLEAIVREAGATKADIVKTTIFLVDLGAFTTVNTIYAEFFGDHRPARSAVQVSALPRQARIEIEAIAAVR